MQVANIKLMHCSLNKLEPLIIQIQNCALGEQCKFCIYNVKLENLAQIIRYTFHNKVSREITRMFCTSSTMELKML